MDDVILLLYLKDTDYGKRLLRFLAGKKNPRLHPELVTAKKRMEIRVGTESQELVILTDYSDIQEDEKRKVIYLSNEQDRQKKKIFQYQKAEGIYRELVTLLKLDQKEKVPFTRTEESSERGVYYIFSPEGRETTVLSVMLAQYLGNIGRCLYLSLAGFPVYYEEKLKAEPDFRKKGVGELLFLLQQEDFVQREHQLRQPFGKAWMLAPMSHFKDILDCQPSEWSEFLRRLREECGYDSIVVEMGQLYEYTLELMEKGDRIWVIQRPGIFGRVHSAVLRRYCQMEDKTDIEKKIRYVKLTQEIFDWEEELMGQNLSELSTNNQKMNYIRKLVEEEGGTEEDVCIIEEIG